MALVSFKRGTKPSELSNLSADTIYFFTDTKEIYLGSTPYGGDLSDLKTQLGQIQTALSTKADAEDVEALEEWKLTVDAALEELEDAADDIAELKSTVQGHTSTLASIAGEQTTQNGKIEAIEKWLGDYYTTKTDLKAVLEEIVGGKIPDNIIESVTGTKGIKATTTSGNVTLEAVVDPDSAEVLSVGDKGLKVTLPEEATTDYSVTVTEQGTAETGFAKTYVIAQPGTSLNAKINIPKDIVVSSGTVEVNADDSHQGAWIKLVLNNDDVIWIAASDLVDTVTANNSDAPVVSITVTDGTKISATLNNGTVTKAHLVTAVQTTLDHADEAYAALTWGTL